MKIRYGEISHFMHTYKWITQSFLNVFTFIQLIDTYTLMINVGYQPIDADRGDRGNPGVNIGIIKIHGDK